ncbi:hypothetical protein N0V83_004989 [Neocucurbitaria cava]|uniref:Uncharacterized protein n=1 Tax=Neocucurbitaria cava TaxID=798079 RepID=A0A9W9CMR3_9PLEO|nr:hypothetical protein N0V83_004989 [Neocucurbitaria cava]
MNNDRSNSFIPGSNPGQLNQLNQQGQAPQQPQPGYQTQSQDSQLATLQEMLQQNPGLIQDLQNLRNSSAAQPVPRQFAQAPIGHQVYQAPMGQQFTKPQQQQFYSQPASSINAGYLRLEELRQEQQALETRDLRISRTWNEPQQLRAQSSAQALPMNQGRYAPNPDAIAVIDGMHASVEETEADPSIPIEIPDQETIDYLYKFPLLWTQYEALEPRLYAAERAYRDHQEILSGPPSQFSQTLGGWQASRVQQQTQFQQQPPAQAQQAPQQSNHYQGPQAIMGSVHADRRVQILNQADASQKPPGQQQIPSKRTQPQNRERLTMDQRIKLASQRAHEGVRSRRRKRRVVLDQDRPGGRCPFPAWQFTKTLEECPEFPEGNDMVMRCQKFMGLEPDEDQKICYGIYGIRPGNRRMTCPYQSSPGACRNNHELRQDVIEWCMANRGMPKEYAQFMVNNYNRNRPAGSTTILTVPAIEPTETPTPRHLMKDDEFFG